MNKKDAEHFKTLAEKIRAASSRGSGGLPSPAPAANDPTVKEEFEQLSAEVALVGEVAAIQDDLEHPLGPAPRPPIDRLREKVLGEVFRRSVAPKEAKDELLELLARMEGWARGLTSDESRTTVAAMIRRLKASMSVQGAVVSRALRLERDEFGLHEVRGAASGLSPLDSMHERALDRRVERLARLRDRISRIDQELQRSEQMATRMRAELRSCLDELMREEHP